MFFNVCFLKQAHISKLQVLKYYSGNMAEVSINRQK